ncbi:hypothetical protein O6H91_01G119600 [Diphasiastrum complanatum]|uniref:Uncharacterized protein n=4 Tax=Diphasiastrum complanatum TaxID=34168 RepID=A0ACC2EVB9_DIPCM|nr:hypothetical protein O6H91_01G119600 [Diphasiastrum complanatum]KAJ7570425.1 hypothetical protein O6H91_01G119600 [Diphasiastrum complanatum]KAJ7570426.1 hypothetical protein O6H91_01G119600 [Diphasiastrum complanatum]KAJ7570429.1 hypothetical protein O6H91_01G119600 [Diphasiastrum complanatum]
MMPGIGTGGAEGGGSEAGPSGSSSGNPHNNNNNNGRRLVRSLVLKAVCLVGGAFLLRKLTKTTTRWDHARLVADALSGEKFSSEQAAQDPMTYFNLRLIACPATALADGARVLYFEQAFWRTPERPYRQRFYVVKPCPKEMKCDVEVASYAVRDVEEYRNYCDRTKSQRPQTEEIVGDIAEHLTSVYLSRCERGQHCLYEGSTPPGGFPNSWNGATRCTSELTIYKNGEIHCWDRAYDDEGNQVWGVRQGPYEFKPGRSSSLSKPIPESDYLSSYSTDNNHLGNYAT